VTRFKVPSWGIFGGSENSNLCFFTFHTLLITVKEKIYFHPKLKFFLNTYFYIFCMSSCNLSSNQNISRMFSVVKFSFSDKKTYSI
jgi:hypothetical protein